MNIVALILLVAIFIIDALIPIGIWAPPTAVALALLNMLFIGLAFVCVLLAGGLSWPFNRS